MGFCEMIYHATRRFPESEKDGLVKELRTTAMLLLRTITRESVKPQKEFLQSLDRTVEIQLDILLLLKLAFRMGHMEQRVYQTLEEDLKGLEKIVNEMKGLHGIPLSTGSIYDQLQIQTKQGVKKPDESKSATSKSRPKDKSRSTKTRKTTSSKSKRPYSRSKSSRDTRSTKDQDKSSLTSKTEKSDDKAKPQKTTDVSHQNFEGTPLYDDDISETASNEGQPKKKDDTKKEDKEIKENDKNADASTKAKKKTSRGRWSLKRSISRKQGSK